MCSQVITEQVPEIKQVENHLTWIDDILFKLSQKKPNLKKIEYVHLVLRMCNSEYFEVEDADGGGAQSKTEVLESDRYDFEEDYNEESPKYANLFAKLVNKCAKILYVGENFDCVPLQLKELREIVGNLNGEHKRLKRAFEYCIEALEGSLKKFQCKKTKEKVDDLQILQDKWNALQMDKKNLAALAYLKATLQVEFQMEEIDVLYSRLLPEVCIFISFKFEITMFNVKMLYFHMTDNRAGSKLSHLVS